LTKNGFVISWFKTVKYVPQLSETDNFHGQLLSLEDWANVINFTCRSDTSYWEKECGGKIEEGKDRKTGKTSVVIVKQKTKLND
jgi:hypothetical protein